MTSRGDIVAVRTPPLLNESTQHERLVIYLDQKDWSLLAKAIHEPCSVEAHADRVSADRLITLARQDRVILPMSFGHMGETSKWTNADSRYHLALTVIELSRGWQLRHPIDVRQFELRRSMMNHLGKGPLPDFEPFTLEACAAEPHVALSQDGPSASVSPGELN